jgi:hypothetical protein
MCRWLHSEEVASNLKKQISGKHIMVRQPNQAFNRLSHELHILSWVLLPKRHFGFIRIMFGFGRIVGREQGSAAILL